MNKLTPPYEPSSSAKPHGRFLTFEGGEGAGKSTQIQRLASRLREQGIAVVLTREPGGSPRAEAIRTALLSGRIKALGPAAETILLSSARADHLDALIRPALSQGKWVLCDRFMDSTRAYQSASGLVKLELILALERITVGETRPDLTVILDVSVDVGLVRVKARSEKNANKADRFEAEPARFHQAVRSTFLDIARAEPERCAIVSAEQDADRVAEQVWNQVIERLSPSFPKGAMP